MGNKRRLEKDSRGKSTKRSPGGKQSRYARLAAFCVIASVAVALVVAYRNPLDQTPLIEPWEMPDLPEPTIELPIETLELSNEELQAEAVREAETLVARFPQNAGALHAAAMLFAGLHQTGRAEGLWRRCIKLDPLPSGPRVGLATALAERGNDAEAADILSKLLAGGHSTTLIYHQLGTILIRLGRLEEAEALVQQGVQAFPACAANWLLLGQTQNQLRKFAEAESSLRKSLELDDRSSTAHFALANACVRQGKQGEAMESRRKFSELEANAASDRNNEQFQERYRRGLMPKAVHSLGLFGSFYFEQGAPDEGQRLLLRVVSLDPRNALFLGELASNYIRLERDADAYLVQQRLVQLDPRNPLYLFDLGIIAERIGDLSSAEIAMTDVIVLEPDFSDSYFSLARIHVQMGNLEQARSYAEEGVEKHPCVSGYGILALACDALGDEDGSRAAQEMASNLAAKAATSQTNKQDALGR